MTDQDPTDNKPTRRRRSRKPLERSSSENAENTVSQPEAKNESQDEASEGSEELWVDVRSDESDAGRDVEGEQKIRPVLSSEELSGWESGDDIDVSDLARLKRTVQIRFGVFFVIGLVAIYFTGTMTKVIAIGSPVLVMTLYLVSSYRLTRMRTAKTLFADSIYYMGFLFTFVTLMFAISPDTVSIKVIINQMGVALSTTIYGMLVRVIMSHFDGIEMNVDEDVFAKLSETATKIEAITDSLVNSSKEQVNQIDRSTAVALRAARLVHDTLDELTSDDFLSIGRIRDIETRMNAIASSLSEFDAKLQDTSQNLTPVIDIMREASNISREFSDFRLKIVHLDELIDQMNSYVASTGQSAESASVLVDNLAGQIQVAKEEIAVHMANAKEIEAHVEQRLVEIMKVVRAG